MNIGYVSNETNKDARMYIEEFILGRMLGSTGNCTRGACRGAWRALLPLRMKILPGRTALKTLDPMALCTDRCLPPSLELLVELFRMFGNMQETAGFDL